MIFFTWNFRKIQAKSLVRLLHNIAFIDIVDASELINDSMQNNIEILYAVKFDITNIKHESSLTIIAF